MQQVVEPECAPDQYENVSEHKPDHRVDIRAHVPLQKNFEVNRYFRSLSEFLAILLDDLIAKCENLQFVQGGHLKASPFAKPSDGLPKTVND